MKLTQLEQQLKTDLQRTKEELAQLEVALGEKPDFGPAQAMPAPEPGR
jgi:hypothetical protein